METLFVAQRKIKQSGMQCRVFSVGNNYYTLGEQIEHDMLVLNFETAITKYANLACEYNKNQCISQK